AGAGGSADRPVSGPDLVGFGRDRNLHRVMVAVVAALDFDDQVPAGDRPHEVDGVHGCLGAGVDKAPQGQSPALAQLFGEDNGVLGRLGEVRPLAHSGGDRLDDGRGGMAGEAGPVPAVHVDILGAVDVVDL